MRLAPALDEGLGGRESPALWVVLTQDRGSPPCCRDVGVFGVGGDARNRRADRRTSVRALAKRWARPRRLDNLRDLK